MSALATLEQLPLTKKEQGQFAQLLIDEILLGEKDPIKIEVILKALQNTIDTVRKHQEVKNQLYKAIGESGLEAYGAKIKIGKKVTYDYSGCGDAVYNDLIEQQEKLKAVIKARKSMIKTGVDPVTGQAYKPPKTSTTEYTEITFK